MGIGIGIVVVAEPSPGSGGCDLAGGPHTRYGAGVGTSYPTQPGSATRATSTMYDPLKPNALIPWLLSPEP